MHKTINSSDLRDMILVGAKQLELNRAKVDALNVFPVPDGDTGTNMSLTMQSCVAEMNNCKSSNFQEVCDSISKGALKGARGNSGVILSQILKGICTVVRKCEKEVDVKTFAKAIESGAKVAYGAVSVPKEGTILTVIRMMSEFAVKYGAKKKNFETFFHDIIEEGDKALAMTPEMLPVLKKAGVVDSGGMGLMTIIKGFNAALTGEQVAEEDYGTANVAVTDDGGFGDNSAILNMDIADIQYAYCTEFFIINMKKSTTLSAIDRLREKLMNIGDCVICIGDLELVKVHVHTNQPGRALTYALELGELDRPKIENMLEQNRQIKAKMEAERKEMGMLAICTGAGLSEIFKELLVDLVIEGGQTMNPSANDIANAAQKINADHIFIFPNNKNITLAAEQAKGLVENKTLHVIPTKNVPQGFAAALEFNPEASPSANKTNMVHALDNVKVGQVTYAVRNTSLNGFSIKEGDIIGLDDKKILAKSQSLEETVLKLIAKMKEDFHQVITLYYGEDVKEEDAEALCAKLAELYPECDVDFHSGGQPVYYYVLSFE